MRKIIIGTLIFFCSFVLPSPSHAQAPFGGLDVFEFPCTCSPYMYTWFAPLYLGSIVPVTGALAVPDWGVAFAYYELTPGAWAYGFYTPGVQACYWYHGYECDPAPPTMGVVTPYTGVSI